MTTIEHELNKKPFEIEQVVFYDSQGNAVTRKIGAWITEEVSAGQAELPCVPTMPK